MAKRNAVRSMVGSRSILVRRRAQHVRAFVIFHYSLLTVHCSRCEVITWVEPKGRVMRVPSSPLIQLSLASNGGVGFWSISDCRN